MALKLQALYLNHLRSQASRLRLHILLLKHCSFNLHGRNLMTKQSHPKIIGLRHIDLSVTKLQECIEFYNKVIGMSIELATDSCAYLSTGTDNITLNQCQTTEFLAPQRLAHFGFACSTPQDVEDWYHHCQQHNVPILDKPKTFGMGTKIFSVFDPSGNEVEFTYHPPMVCK